MPEPPINYLALVENVLGHFEPVLLQFYAGHRITNINYAWQLLRSAFADVLNTAEWCQLWDHILTGPACFPVFCVVAYNSMIKSSVMRLNKFSEIERFFDENISFRIENLIERAYKMMAKCPDGLHPRQYMSKFKELGKNSYATFFNYPKIEMEQRLTFEKKRTIQRTFNDLLYKTERKQYNSSRFFSTIPTDDPADGNGSKGQVSQMIEYYSTSKPTAYRNVSNLLIVSV